MRPILLTDIGSTFTKVTVVDLDCAEIIGTSSSYTTVETDINIGLNNAISNLPLTIDKFDEIYACSSAAGGLKMMASGLVPELTAQAAKFASLGAGAKVIKVYSYQLTKSDIQEISQYKPDIFLLTGGTDGGNSDYIIHNSKMLSQCENNFPIIYAGNRSCSDECIELLKDKQVILVPNVMPKFGEINIIPTQQAIRDIFMDNIVEAKGLSKINQMISGSIMPTPAAIFEAVQLIADGNKQDSGIGDLMCVDLGGATTDTYSISYGAPRDINTVIKGIPEPYAKRSVEGDMGMRYSINGIVDAVGIERISELSNLSIEKAKYIIDILSKQTDQIPSSTETEKIDNALAICAVQIAIERHAGTMEQTYTPMGKVYVQTGKELRDIDKIILTGGALIHSKDPYNIVKTALETKSASMSLKPTKADVLLDKKYILSAMGLLSQLDKQIALTIMKKELIKYGTGK